MSRRLPMVFLAVALGLFGVLAVSAYVKHADSRATSHQVPLKVLVAKVTIPSGTSAEAASAGGMLKLEDIPRTAVPSGALADVTTLKSRVATSDILAGQVLLAPMFGDAQPTGALTVPEGKLAVSVTLTDPARVAGFVVPGSSVAIFDTYKAVNVDISATQRTSTSASVQASGDDQMTRILLPKVQVIAVGPTPLTTAVPKTGEASVPTTILTLALDVKEAEKVIHATQTGKLYFALLGAGSKTAPDAGVNNTTLFN